MIVSIKNLQKTCSTNFWQVSFENKNIRVHTIITLLLNIVLRILDDSWKGINKIAIIYRCDCVLKNLHIVIRVSGFHSIDECKVNIQNQFDFCISDSRENEKFWSLNIIQKYYKPDINLLKSSIIHRKRWNTKRLNN